VIVFINSIIILIFLFAILFCFSKFPEVIKSIDKNDHRLYPIYPFADWLLQRTPLGKMIKRNNSRSNIMKALYTTTKPEGIQHMFWCGKISLVIIIIILFHILSLFSQLAGSSNSVVLDQSYLVRPEYGEGSKEVELNVAMNKKEGTATEEAPKSQDISINLEERKFSEEEINVIFEKGFRYVEEKVLGDNRSADQIVTNLDFISRIPESGVVIEWRPENQQLISMDGAVNNSEIEDNGLDTTVTVILTCQKMKSEHQLIFHILPKKTSAYEALMESLKEELLQASGKSSTEHMLKLPDTLGTYRLSWRGKKSNSGISLLFMGIITAIAAWWLSDKELDKKMKKRKEQLLSDYPELINKFTLLVNAGMTMKQAFIKMAEGYLVKTGNHESKKRYAYEEMLITVNELKLGIPENVAYEQYGKRIGLISYIKFSSLITQNLKKGTKGFTDLMMREAKEAFEDRKEAAKRLGEEAGTKLLIPMMLMLIMVFLIIMIPAFKAFRM
jgi:tight adherence protein C